VELVNLVQVPENSVGSSSSLSQIRDSQFVFVISENLQQTNIIHKTYILNSQESVLDKRCPTLTLCLTQLCQIN